MMGRHISSQTPFLILSSLFVCVLASCNGYSKGYAQREVKKKKSHSVKQERTALAVSNVEGPSFFCPRKRVGRHPLSMQS
jgi:hypothetical protein